MWLLYFSTIQLQFSITIWMLHVPLFIASNQGQLLGTMTKVSVYLSPRVWHFMEIYQKCSPCDSFWWDISWWIHRTSYKYCNLQLRRLHFTILTAAVKKIKLRGGEFDCWGCEKEKYDNIYFPKTLWGDKKIVETRKVLLVKDLTCNDPFFPKNSAHNTWRLIQSWKGKWMLTSTHLWSSKMDFFHDDNFLVFPLFRLLL